MAVTQYTKMIDNNGDTISVEESRVERFLSEGWTLVSKPKEEKKDTKTNKNTPKKNINDEEDYFLGHFKGLSIWVPKDKNEYDKRISEFKDSTFSKQVQINEKYWSELIYSF